MAKRKNSTALFEVMRAAQQTALKRQGVSVPDVAPPPNRSAGRAAGRTVAQSKPQPSAARSYAPPPGQSQYKPLGTPSIVSVTRKWLSSMMDKKPRADIDAHARAAPAAAPTSGAAALDPSDPTAGMTAQTLASRPHRDTSPAQAAPTQAPCERAAPIPAPEDHRAPAAEPNPQQVFVDAADVDDGDVLRPAPAMRVARTAVSRAAGQAFGFARAAISRVTASRGKVAGRGAPARAAHGGQLAIDRDRQEVTVKVRYQTVIIGLFAALSVIALAYIIGKKAGGPTARQPTSGEIREGAAQPGVLDPHGSREAIPPGDGRTAGGRLPHDATSSLAPSHGAGTSAVLFRDAPARNGLALREPGLNYCVIASYSPEQQQWALDVRDYLNSTGIHCTIEIGRLSLRTRSGDYIVVGTRGFEPGFGEAPSYDQYKKAIEQAGRSFPDKSKFNIPQMMMVKWVKE